MQRILITLVIFQASLFAQTLTTLYTFQGGIDGKMPAGRLMLGPDGTTLYGATSLGGYLNCGEVFKLAGGVKTRLHSFRGGLDGENPNGDLVLDAAGNLYGTTCCGGAGGYGTVFRISPSGTKLILFKFSGANGMTPVGGVVMDASGNLYGVTQHGGANGYGTIYQLTKQSTGFYTHKIIYQMGFPYAEIPYSGPTMDAQGSLWVTVPYGHNSYGTLVKLTKNADGTWGHKFPYSFTAEYNNPIAPVVMDGQGNIYGTTTHGFNNQGGAWELSGGQFTPLAMFTGSDGYPTPALAIASTGVAYGEAFQGGETGYGSIYRLNPYSVVYSFTAENPEPYWGLIPDSQGNLYGVTLGDNISTWGSVFELQP